MLLFVAGCFGEVAQPEPEPAGPYCGDGLMNQVSEQCDDGNTDETDVCQRCILVKESGTR